MDIFWLKLILVTVTSLLIFAFMMYVQKKKEDKATKVFNDTLKRIAKKYDKQSKRKGKK